MRDDDDMTAAEFLARQKAGVPVRVVTSRAAYEAELARPALVKLISTKTDFDNGESVGTLLNGKTSTKTAVTFGKPRHVQVS